MATAQASTRRSVAEQTRRGIVDSALKLFGRRGYDATSVQEITNLAGVTKGAFYHHFESKEALLRLIHDEYIDHQLALSRRVLEEASEPDEQLRGLIMAILDSVAEFQPNVAVYFQERRALSGEQASEAKRKREELDRMFRDVISRGVASGAFLPSTDVRTATLGIVGMAASAYEWYQPDGPMSASAIGEQFANLALDGLRSHETSRGLASAHDRA